MHSFYNFEILAGLLLFRFMVISCVLNEHSSILLIIVSNENLVILFYQLSKDHV